MFTAVLCFFMLPDLARLRFNSPVDAAELGVSLVDELGHVLN